MKKVWGRCAALLLTGFVPFSAGAGPLPVSTATETETNRSLTHGVCAEGRWRLDGAAARSDAEGTAALPAAWAPALDAIAGCLAAPDATRACLVVQGQHDEKQFPTAVVRVFGGQSAAQIARARGRAGAVLQALAGRGVEPRRLHEAPPSAEPSFRGVEIVLDRECLPAPPSLSPEDRQLLEEARRIVERDAVAKREEPAPAQPPPAAPAAPALTPFVEPTLHGSLANSDAATVLSPGLRAAVGARGNWLGARVGLGAGGGSREEDARALEAFAAAEIHVLPWLSFGPVAGLRYGAPAADGPWLERSFFAGIEAAQRLLTFAGSNHLLLQQAFLPFGSRERRGEITGDRLERIPSTSESQLRFELGLSLRHDI